MAEPIPITGLLRDVVVDVTAAIDDELAALATDTGSAIHVRNGHHVGTTGADRLWSFEFDGGLPVPPETPARLTVPGREPIAVTILAVGDLDLVLGVREELGEHVGHARLSAQPRFIYDRLRGRLAEMLDTGGDTEMLEALLDLSATGPPIPDGIAGPTEPRRGLDADQQRAVTHATTAGLRFVWGPPGTGKTNTMAATVEHLAGTGGHTDPTPLDRPSPQTTSANAQVLTVAHANAAVDVAMARIADMLHGTEALAEGRVLRVGTPQLDIVRHKPEILPDQIIARQQPDLVREQDELHNERRMLSTALKSAETRDERAELTVRLDAVRVRQADNERRLSEARSTLVTNASIIGTTLSKVVLDDLLWRWPSSAVIVDEASMSGLPFLVALALRGASTLACFGDFRQLPPIALSSSDLAQAWLARDVFHLAGVVSRVEAGEPDPRVAMLRTQYRMGEQIADVISEFAYFGMLRTEPSAQRRAEPLAQATPAGGHQIVVVDTSNMGAACLADADATSFSRFNVLSATLASSLAMQLAADGANDVGIVTAYRAQSRVLAALARHHTSISASTTHRFQGSERDAIVIDLVDADPQEGPSRLTGRDIDLATRLLNVAASRPRGKLIVLVDLCFLEARHASTSPARRLIDLARASGAPTVSALDLLDADPLPGDVTWCASWDEAMTDAVAHAGAGHVDVSVPDTSFAGPWLAKLANRPPGDGGPTIVRAPTQVALTLEDTVADLRLRTLGAAPLAFLGDETLVTGSTRSDGPAARVTSPAVVAAVRRLVLPAG